jgi:hypothetical protein
VSFLFFGLHGGWWGRQDKFPPEEGVWGNGSSPIVNGQVALWRTLPLRRSGLNAFSFQTRMRACRPLFSRSAQVDLLGQVKRNGGGGSIYGDGRRCEVQVRLRARPTFQSEVGFY